MKILIQHIQGKTLGSAFPGDAAVAVPEPCVNSEALDNNAYKLKIGISTPAEGSKLSWVLTAIDCFYQKV